jgi:glycosyltransferase involved in cell wall biosynthesis
MRILMLTNTYPPVLSGVARSIVAFEDEYRRRGHEVLVIAPESDEIAEDEPHVVRVPAFQHFNGSEFPLPVPAPGLVSTTFDAFQPEIVHAHHPFFMGNTAVRLAHSRAVPLVFTHHTMWDQYGHYASAESPAAARFIGALVAGYANLCDAVIAPSHSVADLLRARGVETRIEVIPTGVDVPHFATGDGGRFRAAHQIPADAFVVGYVGRLAPEKNLRFLAEAVGRFLATDPRAHFLVVGSGPSEDDIRGAVPAVHCEDRLHLAGVCEGQELIDAYHALDVFAFASHSETQGMVLTEAMAAGKPVVALDGPGVRDVMQDRVNGRLVPVEHRQLFVHALTWVASLSTAQRAALSTGARRTAERFSMPRQARRALSLYESLVQAASPEEDSPTAWSWARRRIEAELTLWNNLAQAASRALENEPTEVGAGGQS